MVFIPIWAEILQGIGGVGGSFDACLSKGNQRTSRYIVTFLEGIDICLKWYLPIVVLLKLE